MNRARVLLLSDLHLPSQPSPYREAFIRFLDGPARQAKAVYILGDLFDAWIGDDIGLRDYAEECQRLKALMASGVPVWFQHGNRDFLVGERFAAACGVRLLAESEVIELPVGPTLVMHGDALCIDDAAFQRFRRCSQKRWLRALFLALPIALRRAIAGSLQQASHHAKAGKVESIMDVNPTEVRRVMKEHGVTRLIHGHTHRPAQHRFTAGETSMERIVLPDWRPDQIEYLVCDSEGLRRASL